MITVGSLFSGIGGIELGLERTGGFKTLWFCENEPYPSEVLKKNFPGIPNLGDITEVNWDEVEKPEMLTGGFPCQDISFAGKGAGIKKGKRSSLWKEYFRAICEIRPKFALIENVPALTARGLDTVFCDLAKEGYDAEWFTLSAAEVGALHKRERLFIIAHPQHNGHENGLPEERGAFGRSEERRVCESQGRNVENNCSPNNECYGLQRCGPKQVRRFEEFSWCKDVRRVEDLKRVPDLPEPLVCGARNGVSKRMDNFARNERIKALGNAVVPACAQQIGEMILESVKNGN